MRHPSRRPRSAGPRPPSLLALWACLVAAGCGGPGPLPPRARALNAEGAALLAEGTLDAAEARLRLALEHHAGFAEARANLGLVALARGELGAAARHLEDALDLAPDLAEAWNDLGIVRERRGDPRGAREAYRRALAIDPAFPAPRRNLVGLLVGRRAWREARAHILRLEALVPGDAALTALRAYCDARLE